MEQAATAGSALLRVEREGDPQPVERPAAAAAEVIPADLAAAQGMARTATASAGDRQGLAQRRLHEARRLQLAEQQVLRLEAEADQLGAAAEEDAQTAEEHAAARDNAAVALAEAWRAWCRDPQTAQLLGQAGWADHPLVGPLVGDATVLAETTVRHWTAWTA